MRKAQIPERAWSGAVVQAKFRVAREQDRDNLLAWLKATFDGIELAGLVANDNTFTYEPVEVELFPKKVDVSKRGLTLKLTAKL
ncbi:MAG: hypothetical protein QM811_06885 [Pirellulales bacterium]